MINTHTAYHVVRVLQREQLPHRRLHLPVTRIKHSLDHLCIKLGKDLCEDIDSAPGFRRHALSDDAQNLDCLDSEASA